MDQAELIARDALRIAIVTETYPPEVNGVALTMAQIVAGLLARGHHVALVRPRQHAADAPRREARFDEMLQRGFPLPRYEGLKLGLPARAALMKHWREHASRPDIVHVVTEGPLGASAVAAARSLGLPVSSDFHTNFHSYSTHYGFGLLKRPIEAYLRRLHNRAGCTMVPTRELRDQLAARGFERLEVVARGVDTALFSPAKRSRELRRTWGASDATPVVAYVGRVAAEKNIPLVFRTFDALRAIDARARLVVVGDGPERAHLQARYGEHVFAGLRRGDDLAAHYASADMFLFCSLTETFGNVVVEAMASGLAIVGYDYAAAREHLRHDENACLAPFDNDVQFIEQAKSLVGDRARIDRLRVNARAHAERLSWQSVIGEFERVLLKTIAASQRAYATA